MAKSNLIYKYKICDITAESKAYYCYVPFLFNVHYIPRLSQVRTGFPKRNPGA